MYTRAARVATSDVDETGRQTVLSMVRMMQDCSFFWLETQPVLSAWLERERVAMMVASREVEVRRRPSFGERLSVSTWIYKMQPLMGWRNTCIIDESGQVVVACWATGVFFGLDRRRAVHVPDEVVGSIEIEPALDMAYGKRKIRLPAVQPQVLPDLVVQRSDIDFNGHVNNAQYVRMAYDLLPHDVDPARLRITHDGQARRGQAITPVLYRAGDAFTYVLRGDAGEAFAVVEFTQAPRPA